MTINSRKLALVYYMTIAETIRECSPVVSGHLYAGLMSNNFTLQDYDRIIDSLKRARLVNESNYVLTWIGPNKIKE